MPLDQKEAEKRMNATLPEQCRNKITIDGTLTKDEESSQMPKAGQANNHSSTSLETDSGKGSKP